MQLQLDYDRTRGQSRSTHLPKSVPIFCWLLEGKHTILSIVAYDSSFFPTIKFRNKSSFDSISRRSYFPSFPRFHELHECFMSDILLKVQLRVVVNLETQRTEERADGIDIARDKRDEFVILG